MGEVLALLLIMMAVMSQIVDVAKLCRTMYIWHKRGKIKRACQKIQDTLRRFQIAILSRFVKK